MKCKQLIPLLALSYIAIACGGGGTSGPSSSGALFITDSLDGHDHVWVKVHKVVLRAAGGGTVTAFNDADGTTVDLKALRDLSGERYSFMSTVKSGSYTSATVTVDKDLVLFAAGSSTGDARVFAGNNGATADLFVDFGGSVQIGPTSHCALDFDLTNWNDDGVTVTGSPFLKVGTGVGLDDLTRHERSNRFGIVANLSGSAPNQTFTIMVGGKSLSVMTNSETVLCGFASLSNGMQVRVRGAFSTSANAFIATSIQLDDDGDEPEIEGSASSIVALAGTFDIEIEEVENIMPMVDTVHVVTNGATVFTNVRGQVTLSAAFFLALLSGDKLEVKGSYNAQTNVMTATRVEFADEEN